MRSKRRWSASFAILKCFRKSGYFGTGGAPSPGPRWPIRGAREGLRPQETDAGIGEVEAHKLGLSEPRLQGGDKLARFGEAVVVGKFSDPREIFRQRTGQAGLLAGGQMLLRGVDVAVLKALGQGGQGFAQGGKVARTTRVNRGSDRGQASARMEVTTLSSSAATAV